LKERPAPTFERHDVQVEAQDYLILREDEIIGIAGDVAGLRCDLLRQIAAAAAGVERVNSSSVISLYLTKQTSGRQKLKTSEPSINATRM
jgi:hypothetical protein